MKIAYLILGLYNSAGMERIVTDKVNYLSDHCGYDLTVYTTDQQGRTPNFALSDKVKHIDLGINYTEMNEWGIVRKTLGFIRKQKKCKAILAKILKQERNDIVISTFGPEIEWLYDIDDGSRKIAELHFSTTFRTQQNRKGLWKLADYYRTWNDRQKAAHYDRIVTIASADTQIGNKRNNAIVIPNFTAINPREKSTLAQKRIVAVGRLTYYKGYDRLIKVWAQVATKHTDWVLDIYGSGEDQESLSQQIKDADLADSMRIFAPVQDIERVFTESSISVLASRHEGFGLVLIEAMACGVPCVAFNCPCGPRDVISDGVDGFLVDDGNIEQMAERICQLIENSELRKQMGQKAVAKVATKFSTEAVMPQWAQLFNEITQ